MQTHDLEGVTCYGIAIESAGRVGLRLAKYGNVAMGAQPQHLLYTDKDELLAAIYTGELQAPLEDQVKRTRASTGQPVSVRLVSFELADAGQVLFEYQQQPGEGD